MVNVLRNKRGSSPVTTAVVILAFSIVISAAMFYAWIGIQCTVIRNALNKGLSTLAVTISEDTYKALRESDFEEYANRLTGDSTYKRELEDKYKAEAAQTVELENERYRIENIALNFTRSGRRLDYECTCDAVFTVALFGNSVPVAVRSLSVSGSHTAKYGRPDA